MYVHCIIVWFRRQMNQTWILYEVHRTQISTEPTERWTKNSNARLQNNLHGSGCSFMKNFVRMQYLTSNVQLRRWHCCRLLPNEQLEHQNKQLAIFFFHLFSLLLSSLCVVFRCSLSSSSFLKRFHWLNMACHWGIQHTKHTTIKPKTVWYWKMLSKKGHCKW